MSNGLGLVGGNLNFAPLECSDDNELGLLELSSMFAECDRSIPDELLLFGDDGSDAQFGLWLPEGAGFLDDCPVIELIETEVLVVAGTSLCRFLKGRTARYLLIEEAPPAALDALGLPDELRADDPDYEEDARITLWADPDIRDPFPDSYERGVTADELRARFSMPTPPFVNAHAVWPFSTSTLRPLGSLAPKRLGSGAEASHHPQSSRLTSLWTMP